MRRATLVPAALLAWAHAVNAQAPGPSPAPEAGPSAPSTPTAPGDGSNDSRVSPPQTSTTTTYFPLGVPAPGTDLNPGLPSSSRPIIGDQRDGFDLGGGTSGPAVVYGEKGGEAVLQGERVAGVPDIHLVKKGDTLWDLCDQYFHSPWEWPRVWSYNSQVQNPHWIYPGDQLRLRHPNELASSGRGKSLVGGGGLLNRGARVPKTTVFLRDQGFLGDAKRDVWGELVGAVEEQMLLADGNQVYLMLKPGLDVKVGQELTVFREVRQPDSVVGARKPPGEIVAVSGTVRISRWDPKTRVASADITESVDVIERGAKVGPVGRRFDVIPPQPNRRGIDARVLTSLYPHVYLGQNQIVFLDRGSSDGLEPGNTLFVLRRGDTWRTSLSTDSRMARDRVKLDSPKRVDIETTPFLGNPAQFPDEAVAELRVLRAEKYSAVALVMQSRRELIPGDRAFGAVGR